MIETINKMLLSGDTEIVSLALLFIKENSLYFILERVCKDFKKIYLESNIPVERVFTVSNYIFYIRESPSGEYRTIHSVKKSDEGAKEWVAKHWKHKCIDI